MATFLPEVIGRTELCPGPGPGPKKTQAREDAFHDNGTNTVYGLSKLTYFKMLNFKGYTAFYLIRKILILDFLLKNILTGFVRVPYRVPPRWQSHYACQVRRVFPIASWTPRIPITVSGTAGRRTPQKTPAVIDPRFHPWRTPTLG